jgi:hypothetical protein
VWHFLRRQRLNNDAATRRILAFDRALTLALRAALTGGYQCEGGEAELMKTLPAIVTDAVGTLRPTR